MLSICMYYVWTYECVHASRGNIYIIIGDWGEFLVMSGDW